MTPAGPALDVYAAATGRDLISGRKLSPAERIRRGLGPALGALGHFKAPRMGSGGAGLLGKAKAGIAAEKNLVTAAKNGGCFVAGTPVTLGNGKVVPIESVKQGDTLLSRDPVSGKIEAKRVESTSKVTSYTLVSAELADPKSGAVVETITGTPNHPIYMEGRGWVALGELGIGTSVVTRAGPRSAAKKLGSSASMAGASSSGTLVVKSTHWKAHPEGVAVYNFIVEGFHTYFVGGKDGDKGSGGVWVHNGNPEDCFIEEFVHPDELNFSQATINRRFTTPEGSIPIGNAIDLGDGQVANFPAVQVHIKDGQKVVIDGNSRLYIAKRTGATRIKIRRPGSGAGDTHRQFGAELARRTRRNGLPPTGTPRLPRPE